MFFNNKIQQNNILEIIATSDVHGALFPKNDNIGKDTYASLASLSTYIKRERNRDDIEVLLLDNGDFLQGDTIVYYYNYIDTISEHIAAKAMNYLQYDAACVGNHDLEGGHNIYDRFRKQINFPWLSANIINTETKKPYFQPYHIINKGKYKIAILGLTTPKVPSWLPNRDISGMEFHDMVESAQYWVKIIKEKEKPDILIGLLHSGTDTTYNNTNKDTYKNENASEYVAKTVNGFDVIIAGHDHQGHNYTVKNNLGHEVLIIAPTSRIKDFVNVIIYFDNNGKKHITGNIYLTSSVNIDYDYIRTFQPYITEINNYFNEPIGVINKTMNTNIGLFGDAPLTSLIHKIQLDYSGAEISFAATLPTCVTINKGTIYRKDIFNLYKYDNLLFKLLLSGKEINNFLEFSYWGWFNKMNNENDYLIKYKLNEDNKLTSDIFPATEIQKYNFDSADGIIYTVDVSKDYGQRVNIISMKDGSPFKMNKMYEVVTTSYRGSGGGEHLTLGAGIPQNMLYKRIIKTSNHNMKYYMEKWLHDNSPITPDDSINWSIIPAKWYNSALNREYKMFDCNDK